MHNLFTPVVKRKGRGKKKRTTSYLPHHSLAYQYKYIYFLNRKRMSARKELTCTYLHRTKPHILSLFFLSPTLSLPLSAIFWTAGNTSATPCPWGCSRTLPPAWHGTTKAKAIWVHWQRPVNHADQPSKALIFMGTNDVDFGQKKQQQ